MFNIQPYTLNEGCFRLYTIVHELLHTLGFFHMQVLLDELGSQIISKIIVHFRMHPTAINTYMWISATFQRQPKLIL